MSVKKWTTARIKAVLDEPYTRGVNGADYEEIREELERELWRRQEKSDAIEFRRQERYENEQY